MEILKVIGNAPLIKLFRTFLSTLYVKTNHMTSENQQREVNFIVGLFIIIIGDVNESLIDTICSGLCLL